MDDYLQGLSQCLTLSRAARLKISTRPLHPHWTLHG